ncbi:MAG: hypothetical protein ABSG22_10540 [Sedimentisphaerales bacterium]
MKRILFAVIVFVIAVFAFYFIPRGVEQQSPSKPTHIEIRRILPSAVKEIPLVLRDVTIIERGIGGENIRVGPGMNYACKDGPAETLGENERLYVLEEKDGWIRFRVVPDSQEKTFKRLDIPYREWSAWIKKDLTIPDSQH